MAEFDFEAILKGIRDGTHNHDVETAGTIANFWYHSADDRCVEVLLAMPVSPRHESIVAKMCTRPGHCNQNTVHLLFKYAACIRGQTESRRVLHVCSSATCFIPSVATVAMQTMAMVLERVNSFALEHETFDAYIDCCSPSHPFSTRCCAAALACIMDFVPRACKFRDIATLAPRCNSALQLLATMEETWMLLSDQAIFVAQQLMTVDLSQHALSMLERIAEKWPDDSVDNGIIVSLVAHDKPVPPALLSGIWTDTHVRNEQHLLVYLVKYGTLPYNGARLLANVLKFFSVDTRGIYARELSCASFAPLWPPCGLFDSAHTGATRFVCSDGDCTVLTAHLVRHCLYFRAPESRMPVLKTIAKDYTVATLEAFRDMLYADALPANAPLVGLATFCDTVCNTRHACMAVEALAKQDYWMAYDLANDWAGAHAVLKPAAWSQLGMLVRCSRIGEIADMVAGI